MKRQHQIFILTILSLSIILSSCTDLRTQLPTATPSGGQIHQGGWLDVSSASFHGKAIANGGWSMTNCKTCHAPDYSGGTSGESCLTCHNQSDGPENCMTCHGSANAAPPKDLAGNTATSVSGVGVHQSHLNAVHSIGAAVACNECHLVPASFGSTGHIDATAGAEVLFQGSITAGSFAHIAGADIAAQYAASTSTCSNTYCHGYIPNGNRVSLSWTDVSGQLRACGTCHGDTTQVSTGAKALPKTSLTGGFHPNNTSCSTCHPSAINANYQLTASKHINGKIDF